MGGKVGEGGEGGGGTKGPVLRPMGGQASVVGDATREREQQEQETSKTGTWPQESGRLHILYNRQE